MRRAFILIILFFIVFIQACSENEDETTPNDRFQTYVDNWNEKNFTAMYDDLTEEASENHQPEDFIDRYKNIYEDLEVENLQVSFDPLNDKAIQEAEENGEATIPFSVEMDTIGGEIAFDHKATWLKSDDEKEPEWMLDWNPGYIFPPLKAGGEIDIKIVDPERGKILDRHGEPLAFNDMVNEVGIVIDRITGDVEHTKQKVAELLDMDLDTINSKVNQDWVEDDLFVPLKKLPDMDSEHVSELSEIDGVLIDEVEGRVYPMEEAAAHLVGYIGKIQAEEIEEMEEDYPDKYSESDMIGKRGLEELYEDELHGEKGLQIIISKENQDDEILAEKPVEDGRNIQTTIDVATQEKIYEGFEDDAGTAAAIDPETGETLALVSAPAFNPNDQLYGVTPDEWEALSEDPDQPLLNKFTATFSPGSSIKPLTAAIGLDNGTIDPDETIDIKGKEWSKGESWGNYTVKRVTETEEPIDLSDAMIMSDNIYFAMQAVEMGGEAFVKGMEEFGFGEDFPYEYPFHTSTVSSDGSLDKDILLANAGYGQGELQISALHLAMAYTTFLNEGSMLKPVLLDDADTPEVWKEDIVDDDQASIIRDSLHDVVNSSRGTAKKAQDADFAISGKTGTAELKRSGQDSGQENGWFVGYPTEDEDILISMMIEHTESRGGSSYTVEKVTEILQELKK